jgi:DNA-binding response OmpR family regulator
VSENGQRILLVEDEESLAESIRYSLEREGYAVSVAGDGRMAIERFRADTPDLVILDLMLPEMSGLDVCRMIRENSTVPIVMVTAKDSEADKVTGLELGADDYVTKPFSPRELVLRIKKLLGRTRPADESNAPLRHGELAIDAVRHEVRVGREPVALTATEFKLLQLLAQRAGRVQTRERLLQDVWGYDNPIDSRTVDTHMRRLREKLGAASRFLETIRGVGYRFNPE